MTNRFHLTPFICSNSSHNYWTDDSSSRRAHSLQCSDELPGISNAPPLPTSLPPSAQSHLSTSLPSTSSMPTSVQQDDPISQHNIRQTVAYDSNKCREEKKLLLFIALFSINLCCIVALLVLWNIKGISNQNITWALLAVCSMAGFSVFCCVLYFLVCGTERNTMLLCCWRCRSRSNPRVYDHTTRKFWHNIPFSLKKLKNGFGKKNNIYSVQTVFPTPEFQYFHSSPRETFSHPTIMRPKLDRMLSSSKESQISGAAFSAMSTAPASSMLDITEMCGELALQANQNYLLMAQNSTSTGSRTIRSVDSERDDATYEEMTANSTHDNYSIATPLQHDYTTTASDNVRISEPKAHVLSRATFRGVESITSNSNSSIYSTRRQMPSQAESDHSFVNLAMEEEVDNFEYVAIPWERVHGKGRITQNTFASPISVNMYSGF